MGNVRYNPVSSSVPVGLARYTDILAIAGKANAAEVAAAFALTAPLASPALTGTPTAPTATPGTSTTQLANTAFVAAALAALTIGATQITGSTAAGRSMLTAADAAAQRTLLALGSAATVNTGTTAGTIPTVGTDPTYLAKSGGDITGQVNFGGSTAGHSYFDANGDLRVRSGQTFQIYHSAGSAVFTMNNGQPTFNAGLTSSGTVTSQGGFKITGSGGGYLDNNNAGPIIIGATSTSLTSGVKAVDMAVPTTFRDTITVGGTASFNGQWTKHSTTSGGMYVGQVGNGAASIGIGFGSGVKAFGTGAMMELFSSNYGVAPKVRFGPCGDVAAYGLDFIIEGRVGPSGGTSGGQYLTGFMDGGWLDGTHATRRGFMDNSVHDYGGNRRTMRHVTNGTLGWALPTYNATAPADADMPASSQAIYGTGSAPAIKTKDAAGTVATWLLAITNAAGLLSLTSGTTNANGIVQGDVDLYRSGTNTWRTNDAMIIAGGVEVGPGSTMNGSTLLSMALANVANGFLQLDGNGDAVGVFRPRTATDASLATLLTGVAGTFEFAVPSDVPGVIRRLNNTTAGGDVLGKRDYTLNFSTTANVTATDITYKTPQVSVYVADSRASGSTAGVGVSIPQPQSAGQRFTLIVNRGNNYTTSTLTLYAPTGGILFPEEMVDQTAAAGHMDVNGDAFNISGKDLVAANEGVSLPNDAPHAQAILELVAIRNSVRPDSIPTGSSLQWLCLYTNLPKTTVYNWVAPNYTEA